MLFLVSYKWKVKFQLKSYLLKACRIMGDTQRFLGEVGYWSIFIKKYWKLFNEEGLGKYAMMFPLETIKCSN